MRCPVCRREFHPQPDDDQTYAFQKPRTEKINAFSFLIQLCPSCFDPLVIYREGRGNTKDDPDYLTAVESEEVVYPHRPGTSLPSEIPDSYQTDYEEAHTALQYSPKASAALARRLLQRVLREELGLRRKDLSSEIDAFIESTSAPTYLASALDAIRTVGNFAAHPLKNTNTGEIVDVEDGEAEWLIEVLASLFDFVFVQPKRLAARRKDLNDKLAAAGKPPLNGA